MFLLPKRYRRQCSYPLGWLNYSGWVLTHAACCAVTATLALALINLCDADFDVTVRWRLFIAYLTVAVVCWAVNLFGLRGIPTLEIIGCKSGISQSAFHHALTMLKVGQLPSAFLVSLLPFSPGHQRHLRGSSSLKRTMIPVTRPRRLPFFSG